MSPIRRKCRFVLRDVDGRKTVLAIILEELVGKIMSVNKEGVTKRLTELTNETPAAKTRFS